VTFFILDSRLFYSDENKHTSNFFLLTLTDYNNRPSNTISFMSVLISTSGRLISEFLLLLFLQVHRETDLFFAVSGVQVAQSTSGLFHYLRVVFSSQLKSKVDNILIKDTVLQIVLNIDDTPTTSKTHTHPGLSPVTIRRTNQSLRPV
jgi:hypothetical protein